MRDTAWMEHAACKGLYGLHFVEDNGRRATRQRAKALTVCSRCPVQAECRDYVLTSPHIELGIWGGLTENARAGLRVKRRVRCEWCGSWFTLNGVRERMCSDECRRAARNAREAAYKRRRVS